MFNLTFFPAFGNFIFTLGLDLSPNSFERLGVMLSMAAAITTISFLKATFSHRKARASIGRQPYVGFYLNENGNRVKILGGNHVSCYLLVHRRRDVINEWKGIKVEKPNELAVPKTLAQSYISTGQLNTD